jgi:hypothetical protein
MPETNKKQVRKVSVSILQGGNMVGDETYKVVVNSDSTVNAELDWRLEFLKDEPGMSWHIDSDELIREV